jgi:2-dehydro-3-deoxyglucarate aldolase/4-hydroxy-2-oxoheptanedioate aldolase
METFKSRIRNGEILWGTMLSIFDSPDIAMILKAAGFDWFFFDMEHGYPNTDRLGAIFRYAVYEDIAGLVRIPDINKTEIFRALDMGAGGIVCPNVETVRQARELVRLAKYAPMGERGVSMTRPHTGYRQLDTQVYMSTVNRDLVLICQMESPLGVRNLDEILRIDGIDGVLIGPNDLTQAMGILNQLEHPDYLRALDDILLVCKRHGKFCGLSGKNLKSLYTYAGKGMQLMQWGTDVSLLMEHIHNGLELVRPCCNTQASKQKGSE